MTDALHRLTGDDPLEAVWRKEPRVFRPADPPTGLLTLTDLDAVLDSRLLRLPYLELVTTERTVDPSRFCPPRTVQGRPVHGYPDPAAVRNLVADQHTLLLRYVDHWHAPVTAFCAHLATALRRKVEAFYFVTPPGTQGRPVHRDDADVFAVQITGAKDWYIHDGPPADGHWAPDRTDSPGPLRLTARLEPGQVLYVPRGFAHRAVAVEGTVSTHLSLTVREAGTPHLRALLNSLLTEGPALPPRPGTDADLIDAAGQLLDHARKVLAGLDGTGLLDAVRTSMVAAHAPAAGAPTFQELAATTRGRGRPLCSWSSTMPVGLIAGQGRNRDGNTAVPHRDG